MRTRTRIILVAVVTGIAATFLVAATMTAGDASATRCQKGSGTNSGHCWTRHTIYHHLKVVEAVPLENTSHKTGTFHCSFSRTVTRGMETGVSLTSEAKASLFGLIDAGVTTTVHMSVHQTAAQATHAGADFRLKPHQRVVCERTYGYISTKVKDYRYWGASGSHPGHETHYYTARVPAYLGIRVVD